MLLAYDWGLKVVGGLRLKKLHAVLVQGCYDIFKPSTILSRICISE